VYGIRNFDENINANDIIYSNENVRTSSERMWQNRAPNPTTSPGYDVRAVRCVCFRKKGR
jgi:hypothetical protein